MSAEGDAEFEEWAERMRTDLVPKIAGSTATVQILPTGEVDIKFALELGISIMLDKPILALVTPGVKVPDKLVRVADRIIEADLVNDVAGASARISEALEELIGNGDDGDG